LDYVRVTAATFIDVECMEEPAEPQKAGREIVPAEPQQAGREIGTA
jgi:hypothetical protein